MAERSSELGENIAVEKTEITTTVITAVDETDNNLDGDRTVDSLESTSSSSADDADTVNDDSTADTEELRSQIEDTRSQMSETIDAIQEKLSFSNISEQVKDEVSEHINSAITTVKDSVYEATLGKVGNIMNYINKGMNEMAETDVVRTAGKNPLAVTLIGLGIGLLVVNGVSKKSGKSYRYKNNYDNDRSGDSDRRNFSSGNNQSTLTAAQSKVTDAAGKVGETVSGAASKVGESVSGAASTVSGTVSDVAGKAYEQVGNFGSQAKNIAGSAQNQYEYYIEENPLAVGAVALAIGAAVGMSIPSTRFEGELMGETRDNLLEKAQVTARDTIGKVQQVAGSVTENVKNAAGDLVDNVKNAAGDLVENVKESAGDITQTAKDEAKNQGLT